VRVPIVMVNVNRSLAAPWSFWSEQTDSLSQRDTGWLQFYVADNQEALDTVIQAFRISEITFLPSMVVLEAFYTSHFMEPVEVPDQAQVDEFLPPFEPVFRLDPDNPAAFSQTVTQGQYAQFRIKRHAAMEDALEVAEHADTQYKEQFGRGYGLLDCYRLEDAEVVLVTSGTIGSTARVVVDSLREEGKRAGLARIRLFRPFPKSQVIEALKHANKIAVIDRNLSVGQEGIFCEELKSALYTVIDRIPVFGFVLGLGGTNVSPLHIRGVFEFMERYDHAPAKPIFDIEEYHE
jgi:pyruvate/2-oxoacid:ferredoxin oxidoreductase alpha subunit